jgi:hypothetical protein
MDELTAEQEAALLRALAALERSQQEAEHGRLEQLQPWYSLETVQAAAQHLASSDESGAMALDTPRTGSLRVDGTAATSYVYCWVDDQQHVFYVGKGHERRAWEERGHRHAMNYVRDYLRGRYSVHLLVEGLNDDQATGLEAELIGRFGNALVNWANGCLTSHLPAAEQLRRSAMALTRVSAADLRARLQRELKQAGDPEGRLPILVRWMADLRRDELEHAASVRKEAEAYAHISLRHRIDLDRTGTDSNALMAEVVTKLAAIHWRAKRYGDVIAVIEQFCAWHPEHFKDASDRGGLPVSQRDQALLARLEQARQRQCSA